MTSLKHCHLLVYFSIFLPLRWSQYVQRKNTTLVKGRTVQCAPVRTVFTTELGTKHRRFCKPRGVLLHSLCSNRSPGLNSHQIQALLMTLLEKTNSQSSQSKPKTILKFLQLAKGDCENWSHFPTPSSDQALGWGARGGKRVPMFINFMLKGAKGKSLLLPCHIQPRATFLL